MHGTKFRTNLAVFPAIAANVTTVGIVDRETNRVTTAKFSMEPFNRPLRRIFNDKHCFSVANAKNLAIRGDAEIPEFTRNLESSFPQEQTGRIVARDHWVSVLTSGDVNVALEINVHCLATIVAVR